LGHRAITPTLSVTLLTPETAALAHAATQQALMINADDPPTVFGCGQAVALTNVSGREVLTHHGARHLARLLQILNNRAHCGSRHEVLSVPK
jgi:hypothetical protein